MERSSYIILKLKVTIKGSDWNLKEDFKEILKQLDYEDLITFDGFANKIFTIVSIVTHRNPGVLP